MKKLLAILIALIMLFSASSIYAVNSIYTDNVAPSVNPPGGLSPQNVPQFVVFGSDDNAFSGLDDNYGGLQFLLDTFSSRVNPAGGGQEINPATYDDAPVHFSLYATTKFISPGAPENPVYNKKMWRRVMELGNEIGNHTQNHFSGLEFTFTQWATEFDLWKLAITKPYDPNETINIINLNSGIGLGEADIFGFRTPYLEYNNNVFYVMKQKGYTYDCSIEEGYQSDQDGTNNFWPYTLNNGSPGDVRMSELLGYRPPIDPQAGLWEIPAYTFIMPPDSECLKYGVQPGLRQSKVGLFELYNPLEGKVTGLDWNVFSQLRMTKAEALATLKYTLDLKMRSNRCPMTIGLHSDLYSTKNEEVISNISVVERREVLEEFVNYALSKDEVRLVNAKELLNWIKNPVPLQ